MKQRANKEFQTIAPPTPYFITLLSRQSIRGISTKGNTFKEFHFITGCTGHGTS